MSIDSFPTFPRLIVRSNNTGTNDLSFATTAADTGEKTEHEWDSDSDENSGTLIEIEKEVCMKAMTVPNTVHILNDPNIFIGNSGAPNYSTQCGEGISNCKKTNSGDAVMVGSGCVINTNVVGDLPGSICNKNGTEIIEGIIKEIAHCPNMRCNVFSVTKLLLAG